ncbi:aldo/keto reductase, partial [Sodalis-like symbiont of Bactericera trigonica]
KWIIASTVHLNATALDIADVVGEIAVELGASRSQVVLAWALLNPAVVAPIMGARTLEQSEDNFKALSVVFTEQQCDRLEKASALPPIFPARFMGRPIAQQLMFGGITILDSRG